jgi:y4mF family transcriptional regulator
MKRRNLAQLNEESGIIANVVRNNRKKLGYSQYEFSQRVGIGLRFLKELEEGKKSLRMDKVEQVLNFLGYTLHPQVIKRNHE